MVTRRLARISVHGDVSYSVRATSTWASSLSGADAWFSDRMVDLASEMLLWCGSGVSASAQRDRKGSSGSIQEMQTSREILKD
jgi:hypothetical protein